MNREEILKRVIATNIPNYYVTDKECENLYYKSLMNGVPEVLIGPSSSCVAERFHGKGIKTGITVSYPAGTAYPEVKAEEIRSYEQENNPADAYYVTAAVGYFMSGHQENLVQEMQMCVEATKSPVYFFIEAAEMEEGHMETVCRTAKETGVKGIVVSTAFMPYDIKRPSVEEIRRLRKFAGGELETIAFGPFDTPEKVECVLEAGADKIILNGIDFLIY